MREDTLASSQRVVTDSALRTPETAKVEAISLLILEFEIVLETYP